MKSSPHHFCFRNKVKNLTKIGEGVFGEVFSTEIGASKSILKIIPVDGTIQINSSPQKPIREVVGEYLIAKLLEKEKIEGFCRIQQVKFFGF